MQNNLHTAIQVLAVCAAAIFLCGLSFYVIALADILFGWETALALNVGIIAVFCTFFWKMRFVLYENLRILH